MTRAILLAAAAALAFSAPAAAKSHGDAKSPASTRPMPREDAALAKVLAARSEADRSRDAYRHPGEALTFWGLRPGATILEVGPGGGWWTEILAPYAAATGGRYIATGPDLEAAQVSDRARKSRADFDAKYADASKYGKVTVWNFGAASKPLPEPASVDLVLVARGIHGMAGQPGMVDKAMKDFAAVLKPGGVLAVEQHRAAEGAMKPGTGYIAESFVVEAAEKAGLKLDGKSEVNANPKDDRDHPFGVWTLQPVRTSKQGERTLTDAERAEFDAIGESDRMTLRFIKPA